MNEKKSDGDQSTYSRLFDQLDNQTKLRGVIINYFIFFVGPENHILIRIYALLLLVINFGILILFSFLILDILLHIITKQYFSIIKYILIFTVLVGSELIPGIYLMFKIYSIEQVSKLNSTFKKVYENKHGNLNDYD